MLRILVRATCIVALVTGAGAALAFVDGPPASRTGAPALGGAPAEALCINCHGSYTLNEPGGSISILDVPDPYTPGQTYPIRVRVDYAHGGGVPGPRWGFELTVLTPDGDFAGAFTLPDGYGSPAFEDSLLLTMGGGQFAGRQYVTHSEFSTRVGESYGEWTVDWTAPGSDIGPVGFFASGNAANGDLSPFADRIYAGATVSRGPGLTAVAGGDAGRTRLDVPRPNPFRARTDVRWTVARAGRVVVEVLDVQGRRVRTLLDEVRPAGEGRASWDGTDVRGAAAPNGIYFVRMRAPEGTSFRQPVRLVR